MLDMDCPWCETRLEPECAERTSDVRCPECCTSFLVEGTPEPTLAQAA